MHKILTHIAYREGNGRRKKLFISKSISEKLYILISQPVLGTLITIYLLPALFSSCMHETDMYESSAAICMKGKQTFTRIGTIEIFTFNDDGLFWLDSYQKTEFVENKELYIRSQKGDKVIAAIANSPAEGAGWAGINSFKGLYDSYMELSQERRGSLFMSGTAKIAAGSTDAYQIDIRPLVAEIRLRSLRCDFRDKSYEGESVTGIKVYLTNVNARCSILAEGDIRPTHILNNGRADEDDILGLADPGLIYREIGYDIGSELCITDISLFCYPNSSPEEGPGTPFTRLIIEGMIGEETFWWPVEINRDGTAGTIGIFRNCSYIYDIVLTGKGTSDPEELICMNMAEIEMEIMGWKETEDYSVPF